MANYTKFGIEKGFAPSAVYRWLHGEMPRADTFYQLCLATKEQAHWYLLGERVPEPVPGSSIVDYLGVLGKHTREKAKAERRAPRRKRTAKPAPIRGGSSAENPLPVDQSSRLKKKHTKGGVSGGIDATLCQLRGWTMARCLRSLIPAAAHGTRRLAA